MLVQGYYHTEATDLLFLLYENEIAFSVPQLAKLLNNMRKIESVNERTLAALLEVRFLS